MAEDLSQQRMWFSGNGYRDDPYASTVTVK
jgi:hypothetical protein